MAEGDWTHDGLQRDLANHLSVRGDRMLWEDIQLGPTGSPRPDLFAVAKSFVRPQATAYELKVSVADLRADLAAGKWQSYLQFAGCVVFAVPQAIAKEAREAVPRQCGLMIRSERGWRTHRRAIGQATKIPWEAMQKLLITGLEREHRLLRARQGWLHQRFSEDRTRRRVLGDELANLVTDTNAARLRLEHLRQHYQQHADREREQFERGREALQRELAETAAAVGLPETASVHAIVGKLRTLRQSAVPQKAACDVRQDIERLRKALQRLEGSVEGLAG